MIKSQRKNILGNVLIMNFSSIISRFFQLIFIVAISRYYGTELFGYYGTANTTSIIFITIFSFGSGFYLTREISVDKNLSIELFNNVLKIRILFLIIASVLYLPMIHLFPYPKELKMILPLFFFIGAIKGVLDQCNQLYQAYKYFKTQVFFDILIYFGLMCIGVFTYYFKIKILTFSFIILIHYLCWMIIEIKYIQKRILYIDLFSWNRNQIVETFKGSLPFLAASLIGIIYHRVDIFMLGYLQNQSQVGLYVAPYNIYEAFLFIPVAFGSVIFPIIAPLLRYKHYSFVEKYLGVFMYLLLLIIIPISVVLFIFAKDIINLIFGSEFDKGSVVLIIISGGLIFNSFNNILGRILYGVNQEKYQLKISIISILINIVLNLILIPKFSINGAAISTIISFILSFFLHYVKVKKEIELKRIFTKVQILNLVFLTTIFFIIGYSIFVLFDIHIINKLLFTGFAFVSILIIIERRRLKSFFFK